jgi:hypothetical protein
MSNARLVITAVIFEHRQQAEDNARRVTRRDGRADLATTQGAIWPGLD